MAYGDLTELDRHKIVAEARKLGEDWAKSLGWDPESCCLLHSLALIDRLKRREVDAILQAGSASWPRIRPDQDDGKILSHFSYVWGDLTTSESLFMVLAGRMPEMHVWVAVLDPLAIVDITIKYWPKQCKKCTGMDWLGDSPPDYVWLHPDIEKWPEGVVYEPNETAIQIALLMADSLDDSPHKVQRKISGR